MLTRHRWAATIVAALLLTGLAACAERPSHPTPAASVEPSAESQTENTVEVSGMVSRLSSSGSRVFMLTSRGNTVVPIAFAENSEPKVGGATLEIVVPDDFAAGTTEQELYAALNDLSVSTGAPLEVVSAHYSR